MDSAIGSIDFGPIFIFTSFAERLTVIAVDSNVKTLEGHPVDIIFVGTTSGRILKIFNRAQLKFDSNKSEIVPKPVLVESIQIFASEVPVKNMIVAGKRLIVTSDHEVVAIPLHRCQAKSLQSCTECVGISDPYCAWNKRENSCVYHEEIHLAQDDFVQSVHHGFNAECEIIDNEFEKGEKFDKICNFPLFSFKRVLGEIKAPKMSWHLRLSFCACSAIYRIVRINHFLTCST